MKHLKATIIGIVISILLCGTKASGQMVSLLTENNLMVEARLHYGFFYHHHFEMERFNKHFGAFEASIYQSAFGDNEWESHFHYPYYGLTFYQSNLGGFEELGQAYGLYPFINYPLNRSNNSQITFKLGFGLAYLTNHFSLYDNYQNFSIGSNFNVIANISFEYRQKLTHRLYSVASFGLTHFSNGAIKIPNYGLNIFSGALGIAYYLKDPEIFVDRERRPKYYPFEFDRKHWLSVDLDYGIGFKNVSQTLGGDEDYYYTVHELSTYVLGQFTRYSRAGLDISYAIDFSDQKLNDHTTLPNGDIELVKNDTTFIIKPIQMAKLNFSLCYAMTMNRLSYYFEYGWHIPYNKYSDLSKGKAFFKVRLRCQVYNNIYLHLSLLAHYGRADYLCFGVGYRFNQKYYLNHENNTKRRPPGIR